MAFPGAVTLLTSGVNDQNLPSRATGPFAPTVGRTLLAACVARETTGGSPAPDLAVAANSGTWSWAEVTVSNSASNRATLSVFLATVPADAIPNTSLTFTPGENCNRWDWAVWELTGAVLPLARSITGVSTSATPGVTLGGSPDADSIVFGIIASVALNAGVTPGSGFTELVDTANSNQTALQVQYDATAPGTGCAWADCGTTSNLMIAIELSAASAGTDRTIRAKSSNTADTLVAASLTIPAAQTERWHSCIAYVDTAGNVVGIKPAGGSAVTAAITGTVKTQSGDLIIGNTAPSASQAVDLYLGTVIDLSAAPLLAADQDPVLDFLADDLKPIVFDIVATVQANATSTVSLSAAIKDPSGWGYTLAAAANDDGCIAEIVNGALRVTSTRAGASSVTVEVTNLHPRPRSTTLQVALTMETASGTGLGLSGFSPPGSGGPGASSGSNQYGNLLVLDTNLKGGTKSTVVVTWPGVSNASNLYNSGWSTGLFTALRDYGATPSVSVPLCFDTARGDFQGVIDGDYDAAFNQMCDKFIGIGVTSPIFRVGWEMSLKKSFPHAIAYDFVSVGSGQNFVKYKAAFNHIGALLKGKLPECMIDWCNFKEPKFERTSGVWYYPHPNEYYPGGTYIDIISVDFYDGETKITLSNFASRFAMLKNNGTSGTSAGAVNAVNPYGPDTWYDYAKSKGKLFAVPEWGINAGTNGDNPDFIEAIKTRVDGRWSDILAYECYFHRGGTPSGDHNLWPQTNVGTKNATNKYIALY